MSTEQETAPVGQAPQASVTQNGLDDRHNDMDGQVPIEKAVPEPSPKPDKPKSDGNTSFLRAAKAGNLERVLEYLKGSTDINTSNANGLNALHLSSKEGHVNIVTELLNRGANVDAATKKGNTALHIASLAGQEEIVKILVQNNAKINVQSQNGFTPLYMAAQENHAEVVKFLLGNGASQTLATEDGFTPLAVALQQGHDKVVTVLLENDARGKVRLPALHIAAKKDDVKAARLLLDNEHNVDTTSKSGSLVNDTTKSGFTPLHIAAHYGNVNVGKLLIEKNADLNFKARNAITPLHVSSKWGRSNMVTLLADSGASLECRTRDGLTPLHCAARSGHDQIVELLIDKGAEVASRTKNGLSPLHMAAQGDHVDCARIVLYNKAPIDDITVDYLTPLHVAAHCGNVRTAKLLLDKKCEVNARALNGFTPLHIACKKNRIKVVELLLKYGANIDATTESGLTPLHVASFMGHMNIVIYLIQHGANPDTPTVRGETALHLAARANQTDIIRILLRNGATVDAKAREQQTPLHIAARLGNTDICGVLLQHGASPDATTKDLYTPLHIAAKEGQEEVAAVLLDHGASQDLTTKKGFTPLHIAAKYGNIKVAQLLLQREADPNVQGKNGLTPLHVATHYNHVNVALLLLEKGASPHVTAKNGYTPLHIAAKKNQMDIATTLLEYGAKPNAESKNGFTPLHLASQEGHTDMVSLLLERGAEVNCRAKNGLTPMHLAAQEDKVPVAEILVKHGAEKDPQTKAGYTPLHTACHFGQINMIRFLLELGADVNATTKLGYTPLHQAAQQGHVLVINILLRYNADPNAVTNTGQTPLSIAQRLGYISVVEILKTITTRVVTTTTTTEEKYKVVSPETMQETLMTDSEDEGGEDTILGDQSISMDDMKFLGDDSITPMRDEFLMSERYSTLTSTVSPYGTDDIHHLGDDSQDHMPEVFEEEKMQAAVAPQAYVERMTSLSDDKRGPQYGSYSGASFNSSFDPDNVAPDRHPVYSGKLKWKSFLVSFMVDARGGAMRGCRHSGVRIIVPPGKATMPTRVTCKLVKREKLTHPPPLMESEALCSRILQMGPVSAKFRGPVIIEVPHFASLRGKEREIVILRSDNGETWREHTTEATEEAIHQALEGSFEDLESAEELYNKRITRILTSDFPQYFAIVTRIRQETSNIGVEAGMLSSTVVPQVQAVFPEGALTKKIKVGLQAQPIPPEMVSKMLGNRVAVSPIVTVEPRRRKFHKPITLTIPLPKASQKGMMNQYSGDTPTLRLLCSITGGTTPSQWEDITGTTPLTFVNDCVSFTTTVSARFWLMDCQNINEAAKMATELYRETIAVPFMSKFVVFAKRTDPQEARLRVFCMTDDKMDKTLENQEHFNEVARSRDVEVLEGKPQYVEMAGNLVPVTKSGEQLYINFHGFRENRLPFVVRVRDANQEPAGRIAFMKEPRVARGEAPQSPICNLNITLPDSIKGERTSDLDEQAAEDLRNKLEMVRGGQLSDDQISKAELRLTDIADSLQDDWIPLAEQLGLTDEDISEISSKYPYVSEQALVMLHLWVQKNKENATGNELERALRKIGREDVIRKCMYNIEEVSDPVERAVAKTQIDQEGFDAFKEELGTSRDSSMQRGLSLDVSYDEQDLMKDSESIGEESPVSEVEKRVEQEVSQAELAAKLAESVVYPDEAPVMQSAPQTYAETAPVEDTMVSQEVGAEQATFQESSLPADGLDEERYAPTPEEVQEQSENVPTQEPLVDTQFKPEEAPVEQGTFPESEYTRDVEEQVVQAEDVPAEETTPAEVPREPEISKEYIEGEEQVRTNEEEFEEPQEDGSTIRRRVITTEHYKPVTEIVFADGVESSRNINEELVGCEVEEDITELPPGVDEPWGEGIECETSVEEMDETLPNGTWQRKRVSKTKVTLVSTNVAESPEAGQVELSTDQFPVASSPTSEQTTDLQETLPDDGDDQLAADEGDLDEASGGDTETTRVVMRKQVHKKTIIRDGKEETIVTEDTHVEQDNEGPEELRDSMQNIIDQFLEGDQPAALPPGEQS